MKLPKHTGNCELCNRVKPFRFHHLIPVTVHKNKWFKKNFKMMDMRTRKIMLCDDCHRYIHDTYDAKTLGREFNTAELLRDDEKIAKFIKFIRKKK